MFLKSYGHDIFNTLNNGHLIQDNFVVFQKHNISLGAVHLLKTTCGQGLDPYPFINFQMSKIDPNTKKAISWQESKLKLFI